MASVLENCWFTATSTGTGNFVVTTAVTGSQTPASAGAVDTQVYKYRANSVDQSQWEIGYGAYTVSGTVLTRTTVLSNSLGTQAKISFSTVPQVAIIDAAEDSLPIDGTLFGLTLSTAGSSATFGVTAGWAADSTAVNIMRSYSAYTKTTGAWGVGSGGGSLDTGTIAAGSLYNVFLIKRLDTGVVDFLTSLSATAPTMPTSYTLFRRIGAMRTLAGVVWAGFTQVGDYFYLSVGIDNNTATTVTTSRLLITTSAPPNTLAKVRMYFLNAGSAGVAGVIQPTSETDRAPSTFMSIYQETANQGDAAHYDLPVDASSQFAIRASLAASAVYVETYGWMDTRGRQF